MIASFTCYECRKEAPVEPLCGGRVFTIPPGWLMIAAFAELADQSVSIEPKFVCSERCATNACFVTTRAQRLDRART